MKRRTHGKEQLEELAPYLAAVREYRRLSREEEHALAVRARATLEEIGKQWGVSRERIRQVELKTKQFLHRYLTAEAA